MQINWEGEAPVEPLGHKGSPGGSLPHIPNLNEFANSIYREAKGRQQSSNPTLWESKLDQKAKDEFLFYYIGIKSHEIEAAEFEQLSADDWDEIIQQADRHT